MDLFTQRMQQQYGSSLRDLPHHVEIDRESERLCLDMLRCPNDQFPSRAGEFLASAATHHREGLANFRRGDCRRH